MIVRCALLLVVDGLNKPLLLVFDPPLSCSAYAYERLCRRVFLHVFKGLEATPPLCGHRMRADGFVDVRFTDQVCGTELQHD